MRAGVRFSLDVNNKAEQNRDSFWENHVGSLLGPQGHGGDQLSKRFEFSSGLLFRRVWSSRKHS